VTLFKGNGSKENIPSINSSGNALFVYFTSDGNVSESGFSATYYTNRVGKKKFLLIICRPVLFMLSNYMLHFRCCDICCHLGVNSMSIRICFICFVEDWCFLYVFCINSFIFLLVSKHDTILGDVRANGWK
jgi:hypothetical protein